MALELWTLKNVNPRRGRIVLPLPQGEAVRVHQILARMARVAQEPFDFQVVRHLPLPKQRPGFRNVACRLPRA